MKLEKILRGHLKLMRKLQVWNQKKNAELYGEI